MVLACESIFSRTSLDGRPRNLHTLSKVNLKFMQNLLSQWGKQYAVFTCPTAIIYKFYLPGAMGQASMSSPASTIQSQYAYVFMETHTHTRKIFEICHSQDISLCGLANRVLMAFPLFIKDRSGQCFTGLPGCFMITWQVSLNKYRSTLIT